MFAAVDLGSNSFRLHIAQHDGDTIRVLRSARDPIRLGAGLDAQGNLTELAMQTAIDSLARFKVVLAGYTLIAVRAVATNTIRIAGNADVFLPMAEQALGYPIEIISGEEEGRLIYLGVASTVGNADERRLVLDIGGGSTELILGTGQDIRQVESFSVGTVRFSQEFFVDGRIDATSFDRAVLASRAVFEDAASQYRPEQWELAYGSSGTLRAIGDAVAKNGLGDSVLRLDSLQWLRQRLIAFGHVDRIILAGMKPDRAAVVVGGLSILIGVFLELGVDRMKPIEAGLRMGVLWDLHLRATKRDRREHSVRGFLQRFQADATRSDRVAAQAVHLAAMLKPGDDALVRQLYWSALLHEVGLAVSHSGYHKHGAYLVEHADLPGFTTREQRRMALLILAQKGNLRKIGDALQDPDFARAVLALRMAVLFSHARLTLDNSQVRLRMKKSIELELTPQWVAEHPTAAFWMQKERAAWIDAGVDFAIKSA